MKIGIRTYFVSLLVCIKMELVHDLDPCQMLCKLKSHIRLSVLAIAMFVLLVTVCDIIAYELPSVLDSNL